MIHGNALKSNHMLPLCVMAFLAAVTVCAINPAIAEPPESAPYAVEIEWDEAIQGPLPRWRDGGTPELIPDQAMHPYTIRFAATEDAPTSGLIASPPEYAPSDGVIFRYSTSTWPTVVTDCVAALTGDPAHDEIAYVVVQSASQQASAESQFAAAGADLSKVEFIITPNNSIWLRDYGPHFIWQNGAQAIVDSHYYPTRPLDNFIPTVLADDFFVMPSYDIGLYYSGGNFQPGPDRSGFVTSLINQDNSGFGEAYIAELYQVYQGIDALTIFPRLPSAVDGTGHIDMWFYLVDDDTAIISEFIPGSHSTAISVTNNAAAFMENELGFEVIRVPDSNSGGTSGIHYTYTNAFRVNDRIFIPTYGEGNPSHLARDGEAFAGWQAAAPEAEIIPINCYSIIPAAGAIHCIVMQVPRYTGMIPSAHVVSPDGGERLMGGRNHEVQWVATDDEAVTSVDLYLSLDGGATYPQMIADDEVDDGFFTWFVPMQTGSDEAMVKVVAHDGDANDDEASSESGFSIVHTQRHVYDFTSGAGVDKWGWGHQTANWSGLNGVRRPAEAGSEIDTLQADAYTKIAHSDANGSDFDPNRYHAPNPFNGRESTHIFEFMIDEDPSLLVDIEILWEGYGDACLQMELYVWDYVEGQWCDGAGQCGENRYMDNQAANRDATLSGHIQSEFERYLDVDGMLTVLLYAERPSQESMHDYISVTALQAYDGDYHGDGVLDLFDFGSFVGCFSGPDGGITFGCDAGDLDSDADVDFADFAMFQRMFDGG